MANVTFDLQWKEAMVELLDQLELLDPQASATAVEMQAQQDEAEKFQHFATLYVRYLQVFRKLEESYDQMVHPQKRMDIKKALEAVMGRVLEVKEILIDLNKKVVFVNLDDVLVDLKLTPAALEVPVPKFFIEDQARALQEREKLLDVLMQQAGLSAKRRDGGHDPREDMMTLESAIRVCQLNERGRQGRRRAKFMKEIRMQEERERRLAGADDEREPEFAALLIQQCYRGFASRKKTDAMRAEELIFIGMAPPPPKLKEEDPLLKEAEVKKRRKLRQAQHEDEYRQSLVSLDREVHETEGPDMKEEMMDQLRDWYIKYREREAKFPDFPPEEEEEPTPEELEAAKAAEGGKDAKKDAKKDPKKDAKKKGEEPDPPPPPPPHFVNRLKDSFQEWSDKWQHRDESNNFAQKHDVELVKQMVRPDVELRVRDEVNRAIEKELQNLTDAYERDLKAKKQKGAKKGKKGKKKGKKGKKGKGKKGKKMPKDPTGDKSIEFLYRQLVNDGIVQKVDKVHIKDYEGGFEFLGAAQDKLAAADATRLPDPSIAQVRAATTECCVLPLGSKAVKEHAPLNTYIDPKSNKPADKAGTPVLLFGCHGTGKKMLVHAVANETGANLFNLTPSNTDGKYPGKKAYDMVHTVMKVAKALPPSVIWIDQAEGVFKSGKVKGGGGEPPNRILKHLTVLLKGKGKTSGLIEKVDRVLILCTSSQPYLCDKPKDYNNFTSFFAKMLFLPRPDYHSRQILWVSMLEKYGVSRPNFDEIQTLSRISEYYSSGSIVNVVQRTLTARRVERLARKPFSVNELIGPLAKEEPIYANVDQEIRDWYHKTLGLAKPGSGDGKKEKEGKGKKGKGKKKK